jgi:hypothetical protein
MPSTITDCDGEVLRVPDEPQNDIFELNLGRVFDKENPVVVRNELSKAFKSVVLPVPVPPLMRMFCRPRRSFAAVQQELHQGFRIHQVFNREVATVELTNCDGARWDHGGDAATNQAAESRMASLRVSSPNRRRVLTAPLEISRHDVRHFLKYASLKTWVEPLTMISLMESSRIRCSMGRKNEDGFKTEH